MTIEPTVSGYSKLTSAACSSMTNGKGNSSRNTPQNIATTRRHDGLSMNSILCLPGDIIINILSLLPVGGLYSLSLTCKYLHDLVAQFGWASYLRSNPRISWSLSCVEEVWPAYNRVRYNVISERNWKNRTFVARPLSAPWQGKLHPKLAISDRRMVVAAGHNLHIYTYRHTPNRFDAPMVELEGSYSINTTNEQHRIYRDITAVAFLQDGSEGRMLLAGFAGGDVIRVVLPEANEDGPLLGPKFEPIDVAEGPIWSISTSGNISFTLSHAGKGSLRDGTGRIACEIDVGEKSWSSYIPSHSDSFVAIGTSSAIPLAIYPIREAFLSPSPSAALTSVRAAEWASRIPSSAVYGITAPPPSFPGDPGQILVSGWFDGRVRLYDLRIPPTSSITSVSSSKALPALSPIMTLSDPWARESIYSVSSGGGSGTTIAAGTARHSVVAFWDVRARRESWSVHAPGNDQSPVYDIVLESSRLFGATQSRAFVLDFGLGVGLDTYPALPPAAVTGHRNRRGPDDSLRTKDGINYEVTKYLHRDPMSGG